MDIEAPRAAVWAVLRDVDRYPEWNPFTTRVETTFELGAQVRMRVALRPPLVVVWQSMRISGYDEGRSFSWGTSMPGGPFGGGFLVTDRTQVLEDLPGGRTRYATTDTFTGWGAPLVAAVTGRWVQRGFDDLVAALRDRCRP